MTYNEFSVSLVLVHCFLYWKWPCLQKAQHATGYCHVQGKNNTLLQNLGSFYWRKGMAVSVVVSFCRVEGSRGYNISIGSFSWFFCITHWKKGLYTFTNAGFQSFPSAWTSSYLVIVTDEYASNDLQSPESFCFEVRQLSLLYYNDILWFITI